MVHGVKDSMLGRQRVIEAVDIYAHPHLCHTAHQRHRIPPAIAMVLAATTPCVDVSSSTLQSWKRQPFCHQ
jgi:hypothetical protein